MHLKNINGCSVYQLIRITYEPVSYSVNIHAEILCRLEVLTSLTQYLLFLLFSRSVISDSLRHHRLQPTRLLCPWDFFGQEHSIQNKVNSINLSFQSKRCMYFSILRKYIKAIESIKNSLTLLCLLPSLYWQFSSLEHNQIL